VRLTRKHPILDRYANLLLFVAQVEGYRGNHFYANFLRLTLRAARGYRRLIHHRRVRGQ
jgi:hypothetical protein